MDGHQFGLEMVTPEGTFLKAPVDMLEFPSSTGELGILPGHTPLLVDLAAGELRVYRQGQVELFAVAGGFVQVRPNSVRVVAAFASDGEDEAIDAACQRARYALETTLPEDPELITADLIQLKGELLRLRQGPHRKRR